MKNNSKKKEPNEVATTFRPVSGETLLRYEIGFWRDLLKAESDALPPESIERMRQALALAERRLRDWYARPAGPAESNEGRPGTSSGRERPLH